LLSGLLLFPAGNPVFLGFLFFYTVEIYSLFTSTRMLYQKKRLAESIVPVWESGMLQWLLFGNRGLIPEIFWMAISLGHLKKLRNSHITPAEMELNRAIRASFVKFYVGVLNCANRILLIC